MTDVQVRAIALLKSEEQKKGASGAKAKAVYEAVRDALSCFCEQNDEFADAIIGSDKTLGDCCESITEKCGNAISDFDVYTKAVQFYFPGAVIEMKMTVYTSAFERDAAAGGAKSHSSAKVLDLRLEDLLDIGGL